MVVSLCKEGERGGGFGDNSVRNINGGWRVLTVQIFSPPHTNDR